jgi:DNA-binding MarR family transcriptional regulator
VNGDPKRGLAHELSRYSRVLHSLKSLLADLFPAGLDPAAAQLLAWLVLQGPSRQSELAEGAFLDPSTVSRRVSQLVQRGLVERRTDPADGRAVQLVPTAAGNAFFDTFRARREQIIHQVVEHWAGDEVLALTDLLHKFNDDFETYRSQLNSAPVGAATGPTTVVPPAEENHVHR